MIHDDSKCSWTRDHIDVYLDGDLDPHDVQLFEQHLDSCDGCRQEVDVARRLVVELRGLPEMHCPDSVVDAVLDEVRGADETATDAGPSWLDRLNERLRGRALAPALAGAFVLLVIASAVMVGEFNKPRYTDEEIQLAGEQLKWALGYVGKVSHDAAVTVRDDVFGARVARPVTEAVSQPIPETLSPDTQSNGGN